METKSDPHTGTRLSTIVTIAAYNVAKTIPDLLGKVPYDQVDEVLIVDDGSEDGTAKVARTFPVTVIEHGSNKGVGAVIKTGLQRALDCKHDVFVIMAGNGKDNPQEIPRLLSAIRDGYDYVQGSRFVAGGKSENLPFFRRIMVPASALLYRLLTGFRGTDALNGFRAYRLRLLNDPHINIWQDWLDRYELETYLHYKALTLGYRIKEVPVTKSYKHFSKGAAYSHIRPFVDWWSIIRPIVFLALGLRN
jgi:dolichol-phosphate mannosyltransferase